MVKKGFIGAIVLAVVLFGGVILGLMCTERIPAGYVGAELPYSRKQGGFS